MDNSGRTAIARKGPSRPLRDFAQTQYCLPRGSRVLDLGCGKGADVYYLQDEGYKADGVDPNHHAWEPKPLFYDYYDMVLCTYVLNVIESPVEKLDLFFTAIDAAVSGATIMFAARSLNDIVHSITERWVERGARGWITTRGTYQEAISHDRIIAGGKLVGLTFEDTFGGSAYSGVVFTKP